jgi:hypothetical protein
MKKYTTINPWSKMESFKMKLKFWINTTAERNGGKF